MKKIFGEKILNIDSYKVSKIRNIETLYVIYFNSNRYKILQTIYDIAKFLERLNELYIFYQYIAENVIF